MNILKLPWLGPVLAEDFTLFQVLKVANSYFRPAGFTPVTNDSTGHVLKIIIIEKDTHQKENDHIDCPVGGGSVFYVVGSPKDANTPPADCEKCMFEIIIPPKP